MSSSSNPKDQMIAAMNRDARKAAQRERAKYLRKEEKWEAAMRAMRELSRQNRDV